VNYDYLQAVKGLNTNFLNTKRSKKVENWMKKGVFGVRYVCKNMDAHIAPVFTEARHSGPGLRDRQCEGLFHANPWTEGWNHGFSSQDRVGN
jgi:hypothetical protein